MENLVTTLKLFCILIRSIEYKPTIEGIMKMKKLSKDQNILVSIIVLVATFIITEIPLADFLSRVMDYQNASYLTGIIEQGISSVIILLVIVYMGLSKQAGISMPNLKKIWITWPVLLLSFYICIPYLIGDISIDSKRPITIILFILLYLTTGIYEEFLFRGLFMSVFINKWVKTKRDLFGVVILINFLFGVFHIVNLLLGRSTLLATVTQIIYSTFFGVFFSCCLLAIKSIWPVVIVHAIFNISNCLNDISVVSTFGKIDTTNTTMSDVMSSLIVTLPLLIYGLILLGRMKFDVVEWKNR